MDLRHLRNFVVVAEELHFTRAAARLGTAQPALSRQIRQLERELGVELFTRTNRWVELTDTGHVFLKHARQVLEEVERAKRAAQEASQGELGHLAIGFISLAAADLVPDLLIAYRARHPNVDVVLRELQTTPQIDALLEGKIHLGLLVDRIDEPRLHIELLQRQQLLVAMPASHRLAGRRSLRLAELASERWIVGSAHVSTLYAACAKAGFEPVIAKHGVGYQTQLPLVAAGLGLALTAELTPRPPGRRIVYRPLDRPKITVDLAAAWPKNRASPLVDGFLDVARSAIRPPATRNS